MRRGARLPALAAAVLAIGSIVGCGTGQPPNVVLVLVDTLRADCVDPDADDPPMPHLSDLAARSLYYERAYAPTSWTLPSMASLFLVKRPSEHRAGERGWRTVLPRDAPTLAEVFRDAGYETVARVTHPGLPATGIGRGFEDFRKIRRLDDDLDSQDLNRAALAWLDARGEAAPPFFLYLHYMDVHGPYRVHPGLTVPREADAGRPDSRLGSGKTARALLARSATRRRFLWRFTPGELRRMRQLYEGECRYLDRSLRSLFAELGKRRLLERSIVVVTSDHGEEFGAHGIFGHGGSLYAASVRVPLIIRLPEPRAERVTAPVETIGLGPALLEATGIPAPPEFDLEALPLRADGASGQSRTAYFEAPPSHLAVRVHTHGVATRERSLLVDEDGGETAFVLDPEGLEQRSLAPDEAIVAMREALLRERSDLDDPGAPSVTELDAADRDALRRLGYLE